MSGEDTSQSEWDMAAFEEWLTQVAETRGVDEGEVLDRMMSSYWVLDEFEELLDERDVEGGDDVAPSDASGSEPDSADDLDLKRLQEALQAAHPQGQSSPPQPAPTDTRIAARVDSLQRELTLLTTQVERLTDRQASQEETLATAKAELADELDETAAADAAESVENLETIVASLRERLDDVEGTQHSMREDLNADLSHIEEVLRYLVDHTNEFDDRLDGLARTVERELEAIRDEQTGRHELEQLKRTANEHGIERAACERCDESVTLGLLTEPRCPSCSSTFVDVTPKQGWFGSATLEATPNRTRTSYSRDGNVPTGLGRTESPDGTRGGTTAPRADATDTPASPDKKGPDVNDSDDSSGPVPEEFDWQSELE